MSTTDVEKHAGDARQNSETFTSSSNSTHSYSPSHFDYDIVISPADVLTPSISHVSQPPLSRKLTSVQTTGTSDPNFEVDWEDDDPNNPKNWSMWYKACVIFAASFGTVAVVSYSTSYTSGLPEMMSDFGVSSEPIATLGVTAYLVGLAVGSLILAPLSETYGRRPAYIGAMIFYILMIIPAAKATSMAEIIVVRFFGALGGSVMIANSPGTISDIATEKYQALLFSIWGIGPLNGPVIGPVIGGFSTQYLGWRWTDWIVLCMGGASLIMMCLIKETYAPALLRQKAARLRKETDDSRWWCRYDERVRFVELMKINLSRPFVMAVTEQICIFWNIFIAIVYGILYLCFIAYPIVFTERGFTTAQQGLSFVGIGIGSLIMIVAEPLIRKMINSHKTEPDTGRVPPEAAVSIICVGSVLIPIGEFWFAWTCLPASIHWAIPIAAGIPFGMGNTTVFIYATNYLAHSYGIYAASAMAGNSVIRSFMGGTLPLAGPAMYSALGANWAGTLLAFLEVAIIPIPVVFYLYGSRIRKRSTLIRSMQEDRERAAKKRERALARNAAKAKETTLSEKLTGLTKAESRHQTEVEAEMELDSLAGIDSNAEPADERLGREGGLR